jgi:hypothetical protein
MMSIGFKGGVEISKGGINSDLLSAISLSVLLGVLIPVLAYLLLNKLLNLDAVNAGAIAAHYGSVSVVTFITAVTFLDRQLVQFNGYMVGMMALMESPAIFISLLLVNAATKKEKGAGLHHKNEVIKEALFNSSVILLFGSLFIGYFTGEKGYLLTKDFFVSPFQGVLTLFLLEMGMLAGNRISEFKSVGIKLGLFALVMPVANGFIGILLATMLGFSAGSAALFGVLSASASYIAAPAAVRLALPSANPSYYITMSLAITFPFNIVFGIPIYYSISQILNRLLG